MLLFLPVTINEAGIDVVGSFQASDWLQADARGLVGHDVDQPVLEFVAGQVGTNKAGCVGFGVGQALERRREESSVYTTSGTAEEEVKRKHIRTAEDVAGGEKCGGRDGGRTGVRRIKRGICK